MAQKLVKKYVFIALVVASVFVVGGLGGIIFNRFVVSGLSAFPFVANSDIFKKLTDQVTVINKTEQIVISEDASVEKIISQPATSVVKIVALESQNKTVKKEVAPMTGVLLTNDGLLVTYSEKPFGQSQNEMKYMALLPDGTNYEMIFVGYDPLTNLSFFRLSDVVNTPSIALANSDDARTGKKLIALASESVPYQSRIAVSTLGSINHTFNLSGKSVASSEKWEGVIETSPDFPVSFVGGPAVSFDGEMVGLIGALTIDNAVQTFLIPSNAVRESFNRAVAGTLNIRPLFGAYYLSITKAIALEQGLSRDQGALIYSPSGKTGLAILSDSPAMKAGLQVGDIIETVDGKEITLDNPLSKLLSGYNKGDTIELLILRNGVEQKIMVNL